METSVDRVRKSRFTPRSLWPADRDEDDEADHRHHQAIQARPRARSTRAHRPARHDGYRSQRLRPPEGPHGDLSRRRIYGEFAAEGPEASSWSMIPRPS